MSTAWGSVLHGTPTVYEGRQGQAARLQLLAVEAGVAKPLQTARHLDVAYAVPYKTCSCANCKTYTFKHRAQGRYRPCCNLAGMQQRLLLGVQMSRHDPTSPNRLRMVYCWHAGWLSQSLQAAEQVRFRPLACCVRFGSHRQLPSCLAGLISQLLLEANQEAHSTSGVL
jgi:hypothetical protein